MKFDDYILNFVGEKVEYPSASSENDFCGKVGCCRSCMKRYNGCLCFECLCKQCCWHWNNKCNFKEDGGDKKIKVIYPDKIEYF